MLISDKRKRLGSSHPINGITAISKNAPNNSKQKTIWYLKEVYSEFRRTSIKCVTH